MSKRSVAKKRPAARPSRRAPAATSSTVAAGAGSQALPRGWPPFARRLTRVLNDMSEDVFLILTVSGEHRFVQFASDAEGRMVAECVGDHFLEADKKLTAADRRALARIGWSKPKLPKVPDGSTRGNWWFKLQRPEGTARAVELAIRTFTEVYGVRAPSALQYKGFTVEGATLDLPALGLEVEQESPMEKCGREPTPLAVRVGDALSHVADDDVEWTPDGWYEVVVDGIVLRVGVTDEPPLARVIGLVEANVEGTPESLALVNHVNGHFLQLGYTYWRDGQIRYGVEVMLYPFSSRNIAIVAASAAAVIKQLIEDRMGRGPAAPVAKNGMRPGGKAKGTP